MYKKGKLTLDLGEHRCSACKLLQSEQSQLAASSSLPARHADAAMFERRRTGRPPTSGCHSQHPHWHCWMPFPLHEQEELQIDGRVDGPCGETQKLSFKGGKPPPWTPGQATPRQLCLDLSSAVTVNAMVGINSTIHY